MNKRNKSRGSGISHWVDIHVGNKISKTRSERGLNKKQFANLLDVSYQQIQKYESGSNRVSASMLWEISQALEIEPDYFFKDLKKHNKQKNMLPEPPPASWSNLYHSLEKGQIKTVKRFIEALNAAN